MAKATTGKSAGTAGAQIKPGDGGKAGKGGKSAVPSPAKTKKGK